MLCAGRRAWWEQGLESQLTKHFPSKKLKDGVSGGSYGGRAREPHVAAEQYDPKGTAPGKYPLTSPTEQIPELFLASITASSSHSRSCPPPRPTKIDRDCVLSTTTISPGVRAATARAHQVGFLNLQICNVPMVIYALKMLERHKFSNVRRFTRIRPRTAPCPIDTAHTHARCARRLDCVVSTNKFDATLRNLILGSLQVILVARKGAAKDLRFGIDQHDLALEIDVVRFLPPQSPLSDGA